MHMATRPAIHWLARLQSESPEKKNCDLCGHEEIERLLLRKITPPHVELSHVIVAALPPSRCQSQLTVFWPPVCCRSGLVITAVAAGHSILVAGRGTIMAETD